MKAKISRGTILLIVILSIVLVVLIEFKIIANAIILFSLKFAGFNQVRIENIAPGINSSILHKLGFVYPILNGDIKAEADSLEVSYGLNTLRQKSLDTIQIADGQLNLVSQDSGSSAQGTSDWRLTELIPKIKALPFRQLDAERVGINLFGQNPFIDTLSFTSRPETILDVVGKISPQLDYKFNLAFPTNTEAILKASTEFDSGQLSCSIDASILPDSSISFKEGEICDLKLQSKNYKATLLKKSLLKRINVESTTFNSAISIVSENASASLGEVNFDYKSLGKKLKINVRDAKFSNELFQINGARFLGSLEFLNGLPVLDPTLVTIETAQFGFEFRDISLSVDQLGKDLRVLSSQANIAGGIVKVLPGILSLSKPDFQVRFNATDISLSQLLAAYPQKAVEADGQIDASFDLHKTTKGFRIDTGQLIAHAPGGVIRILQEDFTNNHPELSVVMDQLKNFQYDKLEGTINLDEGGDLTLLLLIRGRNPLLQSKRVIELNLTFQDNLYDLARTVRLINTK